MTWATQAQAVAALRTQVQDTGTPQRYTDTELGNALDQAITELSAARPLSVVVAWVVDAERRLRLDDKLGAASFGSVVGVLDTTDPGRPCPLSGWQYYEQGSQHLLSLSAAEVGTQVTITVLGGYGFGLDLGAQGILETNIPLVWRDGVIGGAQGFALDLYGAREVGRANVAPAMAQQTARQAATKLRDFRQWLGTLPVIETTRYEVAWGLAAVDQRASTHRGFD